MACPPHDAAATPTPSGWRSLRAGRRVARRIASRRPERGLDGPPVERALWDERSGAARSDGVGIVRRGGEDDDRRINPRRDLAADIDSAAVWQSYIEQHRFWSQRPGHLERS